ncbi:hypothetical protein KKB10_03495 [Patescibacteria group bacterium]|nr:hypothetical protein [Patescibacteria group bacterium]MBU1074546.1 hypothetical protein [Patescibacteria group bacterium]MBU1951347.1 hypothetical protein [Patescibacteria group bacterium]
MSTSKSNQSTFLKSCEKVALTATIITVIVATVTLIVGYQWGQSNADEKAVEPSTQQVAIQPAGYEYEEAKNITAYKGQVTGVNGNQIDITAKVAENDISVEKTVNITTTESTIFRKIDITKPPVNPDSLEEGEEYEREKSIQISDIQIGDNIIAEADENIYGKTSFQAYEIKVLSIGL